MGAVSAAATRLSSGAADSPAGRDPRRGRGSQGSPGAASQGSVSPARRALSRPSSIPKRSGGAPGPDWRARSSWRIHPPFAEAFRRGEGAAARDESGGHTRGAGGNGAGVVREGTRERPRSCAGWRRGNSMRRRRGSWPGGWRRSPIRSGWPRSANGCSNARTGTSCSAAWRACAGPPCPGTALRASEGGARQCVVPRARRHASSGPACPAWAERPCPKACVSSVQSWRPSPRVSDECAPGNDTSPLAA